MPKNQSIDEKTKLFIKRQQNMARGQGIKTGIKTGKKIGFKKGILISLAVFLSAGTIAAVSYVGVEAYQNTKINLKSEIPNTNIGTITINDITKAPSSNLILSNLELANSKTIKNIKDYYISGIKYSNQSASAGTGSAIVYSTN